MTCLHWQRLNDCLRHVFPQRAPAAVPDVPDAQPGSEEALLEAEEPPPPEAGTSRNHQKKLAMRQARRERKVQRKVQKQSDALDATVLHLGQALEQWSGESCTTQEELVARLQALFDVSCPYHDLPQAQGPEPEVGVPLLGRAVRRPDRYNEKFLPQEYSLIHKVWTLFEGDCKDAGVVDVGAGNACCAVLLAVLFGLTVFCVERESPRSELRAETYLPEAYQRLVIRIESDVEDFGIRELQQAAADAGGIRRLVLLAKHPCGIGADRTIDLAAKLMPLADTVEQKSTQADRGPQILGLIMATCCTNKLFQDDYHEGHVAEFCSFYSRQTCTPQLSPAVENRADVPDGMVSAVETMSRCSAWRNTCGSRGSRITPEQVALAESFEDALQALRTKRLQSIFGDAVQVRFAPRACTMQDRCLLATPHPMPDFFNEALPGRFIRELRVAADALCSSTGPIDCRPRGLKSAKYDFDFTEELPD
mmetsp:Transcript_18339/g.42828  ORF Transcript_18339/g.42828 Transcript_18339/m.42828 type:complete len:479 (+) Transcript_18339:94-1530(+)